MLQILTDFIPRVAFPLVGVTGFIEVIALGLVGCGVVAYHESGAHAPPQTVGRIASNIGEVRAIAG